MSSSNPRQDTTTKATNTTAAESPTTARELDFEDELQENTAQDTVSAPKATSATASEPTGPEASDEVPPPQPPRPLTTQQEAENTLKEAFPGIDAAVVKAVLIASGGKIEPAFNALLGRDHVHQVRNLALIISQGCQTQMPRTSPLHLLNHRVHEYPLSPLS